MHGKINHAPLHNPAKILDVGCGTGIVCRQIAQDYPTATVYGIDISNVPPFPDTPTNVEYITGDIKQLVESGDPRFKGGSFDYVFQRLLICGMTNWPGYIGQMVQLLRPGGYLEIQDYDYRWYKEGPSEGSEQVIGSDWKWTYPLRRGASQLGLDLDIGSNAKQYMENAGLVDVQVVKYKVPFGTWMADGKPETRKIGEHQVPNMANVISEHVLPGVTRELNIPEEEMRELKEECRRCLGEEEGKFWWFYVVWGRKA